MSEEEKKLNEPQEKELTQVSGGISESSDPSLNNREVQDFVQQFMKENYWIYKKRCKICHKEYEVTCRSYEAPNFWSGFCPECSKERQNKYSKVKNYDKKPTKPHFI